MVCLGVTSGAYILSQLAILYPHLVGGLILISPTFQSPSWAEWAQHKLMANLLSFYGITRYVKETLMSRYFCQDQFGFQGPASDAIRAFVKELTLRVPGNVAGYIGAMQG